MLLKQERPEMDDFEEKMVLLENMNIRMLGKMSKFLTETLAKIKKISSYFRL